MITLVEDPMLSNQLRGLLSATHVMILDSLKLDAEVFLLPEGYRHDIQHKNQPPACT